MRRKPCYPEEQPPNLVLLGSQCLSEKDDSQLFRALLAMIILFVSDAYRISELFDILVEYPDSEPALCDLKQCMDKVQLRSFLITSLKSV